MKIKMFLLMLPLFAVSCANLNSNKYTDRKTASVETELQITRRAFGKDRIPKKMDTLRYSEINQNEKLQSFNELFRNAGENINLSTESLIANLEYIQLSISARSYKEPFRFSDICYYGTADQAVEILQKMKDQPNNYALLSAFNSEGRVFVQLMADQHKKRAFTRIPECEN
ncbi:MAG: hypothetical protein OM95_08655 [Bdellovibrio sp. ArHS]|uniref:hypothetical protein n=1 Tax=Bdellovibrio sp. ArHS TaxID=1569284 RepID=UPI000582CE19|nr:hypothetical protein [Bdellovibrio sp. ArHS]KHD88564.1 MAG: hypothetical protein OM95_08655 [Bdellovibrio sp. ArHS]